MDIRQFRNVLAVLEQGSIGRAADALHISQPALTKSIRRLEDQLGVVLFERGPRGMRPTVYARRLRQHAQSLHVGLADALADVRALKAGAVGLVTVGATPLIAQTMLAAPVARLTRERPDVRVRVVSRPTPLIASLLQGEFDFVLTMASDERSARELEMRAFYDDRLVLIARTGHPITRIKRPAPRDLQQFTWMLPLPGNSHRTRFERLFEADGVDAPQPVIECGSSPTIIALAARTNHVGLIPELATRHGLNVKATRIVRLNSPLMVREISMIWRKNQVLSPAAQRLMELIEASRQSTLGRRSPSQRPKRLSAPRRINARRKREA